MARRLRIVDVLPNWSGETLDLVVDFTTYVFVPAYAIAASGLLVPHLAPLLGIAVVVSGALYFADQRMKTTIFAAFRRCGMSRPSTCSCCGRRPGSAALRSRCWSSRRSCPSM
jgi:phosphatidylserine synthase